MKRNTWIVLGVVVVLGLVYVLTKEEDVSVGVKKIALAKFDPEKATKIVIKSKEPVELRKIDGVWKLVLGGKLVLADQSHVSSMFDAALGVRHSYYVTKLKEKYADLGLTDEELTSVNILDGNNNLWVLNLGKNAKEGSGRYAKLPDDENVYVVRGAFWQLARNSQTDWRDRSITQVKTNDINSLKFYKNNKLALAIARKSNKDGGSFEFTTEQPQLPRNYRLAQGELDRLVEAITNLRASGFIDDSKKLGDPVLYINAQVGDQNKEDKKLLEIFAADKDRYLVKSLDRDQVFEISKYNFEKLDKNPDDFRDLSVLKFEKDKIISLALDHAKNPVVLQKKQESWSIFSPQKLPKDFEFDVRSGDDVLSSLVKIRGVRVARKDDKAANRNWHQKPLVKLRSQGGQEINLRVGSIRGNKEEVLVKGNIDTESYVVKKSAISNFQEGLKAFKKEDFELPPIGPGTKGFDSLPVDVQRKLMNASKKKNN